MQNTVTHLDPYRAAIVNAFPDLADAMFRLLAEGWHSLAIEARAPDGAVLVFKFPKSAEAEAALIREASILAAVRPAVTITVPDLRLVHAPRVFSRHRKLEGGQLLAADYAGLGQRERDRLAADLARFYAELHDLDPARMQAAGARAVEPWQAPDRIRAKALPRLERQIRAHAEQILDAYERLRPDPHGLTYGFFDGHGWNMAFDGGRKRLAGIYDFADSGFGPLHQDFIYSNFISADLTARIVTHYERATGRRLDRRRIDVLTACHRLSELAALADDPNHLEAMVGHVDAWFAEVSSRAEPFR